MANMKLYALTDFPDDSIRAKYTPEMLDKLIGKFADFGFSRMYFQYYGNQEDEYFWTNKFPGWVNKRLTAEAMPNMSKVYVDTCKKYGMEVAAVMRPLEQGNWLNLSPYNPPENRSGFHVLGGEIINPSAFLRKHPETRNKRRSYDIDPDVMSKTITTIKLYKQNNIPTRIQKEHLTIYTSHNNTYYKPYTGDFTFEILEESAKEDVEISHFRGTYGSTTLCKKGDPIQVIQLSGLHITEQFVAVGAKCDGTCSEEERFANAPANAIACFDEKGDALCSSVASCLWSPLGGGSRLEEGFPFDDGFGINHIFVLDPDDGEGYYAIAKGKNLYNHGAPCECEPLVQEYWMEMLNKALDDGYDIVGNRTECHSVQVNEPYAYGYNDAVKKLYFEKYGECAEEDMDLEKIAEIRGNVFSELLAKGASIVHARGKKVYATLNIEMLYNPLPLDRIGAYPMNVQWQWERWLKETKPDEINFRMYQSSPAMLLNDPQCMHMLEVAKSYGVPLTVERYLYRQMPDEYKMLNDTGLFDAMIVYETADLFRGTPEGDVVPYTGRWYGDAMELLTALQKLKDGEK